MDVLIKRMKKPETCSQCRFFFAWRRGIGQHCAVAPEITFHATIDGFDVVYERNGDCPLIPVPEHGRLIDAGEIAEHKYVNIPIHNPEYANGKPVTESEAIAFKIGWNFALTSVAEHAPTIIPASEEGE